MVDKFIHKPVMLEEILSFLEPKKGTTIVDATIGTAGHAIEIVKRIAPAGKLVGIDRDQESLEIAKERLKEYGSRCIFIHDNFCNIDKILTSLDIKRVDGVILDLGISSFQLSNATRGFSFVNEGPLDMRMDRTNSISAFDLVNNLTQEEIASLLWQFGQERFSRRIARMIINKRNESVIDTTTGLASIVLKALPHQRQYQRIHPATRTFQALRIAVNQELESLEIFLQKIDKFMSKGGKICILTFHSLEDRIAKINFRNLAKTKEFKLIVKKPITPTIEEVKDNPRSRSAKLRILEKV
ncbi:MAG: 16S rRNA (cytosine(1402)-N(4))-methyltransferase RsmH [Candidatus Omnitrophica bacterium]|nr:16S rRNA (cytosine(1402)-N(4))-methyltransferase RsmH [Candidatus Omnitrophota bacterium]MDD5352800.1 16S rRNA (cytosine(1402)-N(4))-methyltransferase RsmH [Candidatus Omnitrophota bacterium]MDD5550399.1 16S rRNA (cytosine(1402)-N(4))-methyltransferase RsmH [Candidatus Omnitrophota bacterium]